MFQIDLYNDLQVDNSSDTKYGYIGVLPSNNKQVFTWCDELLAIYDKYTPPVPKGTPRKHTLEG